MFPRMKTMVLGLLIAFMLGSTLGLGVSYWEKVEWITVAFYTAVLAGAVWGGYEVLQAVRSYRQAIAHRLHVSSQIFAARVHMPDLPQPEILQLDSEFIETVEAIEETSEL